MQPLGPVSGEGMMNVWTVWEVDVNSKVTNPSERISILDRRSIT